MGQLPTVDSLQRTLEARCFCEFGIRQRRITSAELAERLRKLDALAAGQLRPDLPTPQPKFVAGAPKPTPASYQRFPVGSLPYSPKPRPPIRPENLGAFAHPGKRH